MKQVVIEKQIVLDDCFDYVDEISCQKKLHTIALKDGLECSGTIEISGIGFLDGQKRSIEEEIECSIYAPFYKLSDTEPFDVILSDAQFLLKDKILNCILTFDVYGLLTEEFAEKQKLENNEGSFDDLLDDSQVVVEKIRFALTNEQDTYSTVSLRYRLDENKVKKLNHDKKLQGRCLIQLPMS